MVSNWTLTRLADVIEQVIDNRGRNPENYTEVGIPVIDNVLIKSQGVIDLSMARRFINQNTYDNFLRKYLEPDDVLLTLVGNGYGQVAITPNDTCAIIQNTIGLRCKEGFSNKYLYYLLKFNLGTLRNLDRGAAQPSIKVGDILDLEFYFPDFSNQTSISKILYILDKKINLNNQINQTLEKISQALFKSWFVDFDPVIDNALDAGSPIPEALQSRAELRQKVRNSADFTPLSADIRALFPAEFEETELGWVPKGWQTKSMHDLVESVSITFPLSKTDKVIFLNTGDIEKGSFLHQNYSKTEGLPGQAKKSIKKGDILFSEIRPENKRYAFIHFESDDYVVSTKLMVLRAKNEINPLLPYFIITLEDNTKKLQRIAELRSGTFPQITFKELEFISFIMPNNDKIMDLFINSYLAPAYNKIIETKKANINLINLRDTLLPKLISGELSLEDLPNLANQTEPA
ncbi:restriction endonuclease subunit S [Citrobacter freundii]|uniref:restriction endonuclease subunit S n=1 Tax=Citrobacter freundii TaxID=546 RepID=UPI000666599F|nr:restriction endonuclease subunit S [Citrobacter freundii]MCU0187211.1 restriction endonuclease subunit S [Citrobacter freundii]